MWRLRKSYLFLNEVVRQLYHRGCNSPAYEVSRCKIKPEFLGRNENGLQVNARQVSYEVHAGATKTIPVNSFLKLAIEEVVLNGTKKILHVIFKGREQLDFPVPWLRDNCQCPICFDKLSHSRIHDQQLFNCDLSPTEVLCSDSSIRVIWEDGHVSEYSREWLCHHSFVDEHEKERCRIHFPERISWNAEDFYEGGLVFRKFPVADVLKDDSALLEWLQQLSTYGISLLTDATNDSEQLEKIARRVAFVRKTHYGEQFSVIGSDDADNVAYKKGALQLHTDLPYYHYMPGVIMLHCIRQSDQGGENFLSDGLNAASALPENEFQILAKTIVDWVDIGSHANMRFYSLNREPVLCLNACGQLEKINWSQPQRHSIFNTSVKEALTWYEAAAAFTRIIHDKKNIVTFKNQEGNILTFDNRRILHGRQNYADGARLLYGTYIDWDEIYSKIRVIKEKST